MIGRILADLKRRGMLVQPKAARLRPTSRHARPYAPRKPKDHPVARPGDLVQPDTVRLTPLPGVERRHFTAIDVVCATACSGCAPAPWPGRRDVLADLGDRSPFAVRALRVDGGSELMAAFEGACTAQQIAPFVLPPRFPRLNGRVEGANGASRREFRMLHDGDLEPPPPQAALRACEHARTITSAHTKPWATKRRPSSSPDSPPPDCRARTERDQAIDGPFRSVYHRRPNPSEVQRAIPGSRPGERRGRWTTVIPRGR